MTSDPSNIDPDISELVSELSQKSNRHLARGGTEEPELPPMALGIAWGGIVLAATCFPVVLGCIQMAGVLIYGAWKFSPENLGALIVVVMLSLAVGLIYGTVMSIPAFFLTVFLSLSLKGILSNRAESGIFGGMTGFLCTTWGGWFTFGITDQRYGFEALCVLACVSILAIVMGHTGAILAGYRKRNDGFPFFEPIFSREKKITIVYLMKLTFFVAVLAVACKAAGLSGICIGITWSIYLLVQALLLVAEHWAIRWLSQRSVCG